MSEAAKLQLGMFQLWSASRPFASTDATQIVAPSGRTKVAAVQTTRPTDIVLLSAEWPSRALLRAQLIEEGLEVVATDTWTMMRRHLRPGSRSRFAILDFSKKVENHAAVALYFMHYNFGRVHQTLRLTPAMEAGVANHVWSIEEIVGLLA